MGAALAFNELIFFLIKIDADNLGWSFSWEHILLAKKKKVNYIREIFLKKNPERSLLIAFLPP